MIFAQFFVFFAVGALVGSWFETRTDSSVKASLRPTLLVDHAYRVKSIRVIEGNYFDVCLESEKRYLVRLHDVWKTVPEAKENVKRLLARHQQASSPAYITPYKWDETDGGQWLVELRYDQSNMTVSDHLKTQNLVYHR